MHTFCIRDYGSEAGSAFAQSETKLDIRCGHLQLRFIGDYLS